MRRNYSRFYALLGRMPAMDKDELKIDLVRQYTNNRTDSLKEMTDKEYNAMCDDMQRQSNGYKAREIAREELRKKRSVVLRLMQKHGIDTTDWNRVDAYCLNPRIGGKEFRRLTIDELEMIAIKLRIIQRKECEDSNNNQFLN